MARALIKKPDIVILDDCLSAVDTNTEKQVLDYFQMRWPIKLLLLSPTEFMLCWNLTKSLFWKMAKA
ncbi:MAG: hypothetical protein R2784_13220 [Saprospiraceae bacterium]